MNEAKTTEDFAKARQDLDAQANRISNIDPVPYCILNGRRFYGFGRSEIILQFRQFAVQQHRPR